jgi:hypothetical protein
VQTDDFAQLQLRFVDPIQWRYEVIRPVVLFADRTARQRAHETHTHPATVRRLTRGFRQRGMLGLLPDEVEVVVRGRAKRISDAVRQEIDRLKALYDGFHYRELARILFIKCGEPIDHKTVKTIWHVSPVSMQGRLDLLDYHTMPIVTRRGCRSLNCIITAGIGGASVALCTSLHPPSIPGSSGSRPSSLPGSWTKSVVLRTPARCGCRSWCRSITGRKRIPMPGSFGSGACWRSDISVRTVGRIMALNKLVD